MPPLTSSRDPRQAQVPSYAGAFPSDPNEIARLRSLYPPYSDMELDEAKKGQLIPGEVLYCEVRAGNVFSPFMMKNHTHVSCGHACV
jgi:hypothetical protein